MKRKCKKGAHGVIDDATFSINDVMRTYFMFYVADLFCIGKLPLYLRALVILGKCERYDEK